ncbi:MAG: TCR/Tet family MFS transporter [Hyphomonadaceae bacterium]|nr:TCR/Tet family MFS transporter [Hyphomonadaceae bacterium]
MAEVPPTQSAAPDAGPAVGAAGRKPGLPFILITVWIDVLSWGVTIPVYPKLLVAFAGGDAQGALWAGAFMTLFALIQLFASPLLGALSDAHGRRPVILVATAGLAVDLAIMAFAQNLWWLLVTRVIHAVTAATHATAGAYIADVTAPQDRARAFGLMGAAFSFGFIVGPGLGGVLGQIDLRLPFLLGAALAFANVVYGYFVLPESLPKDKRTPFTWRTANPLGALAFLRGDPGLLALSGVNFLSQLAHQIYPALWVLYTGYRYQWDAQMVGITLAVSGLLSVLVQAFLVGPVVKRWGERNALFIGFAFWAVALAVEGWAPTGFYFLIGIPLGALSAFSGPALNALMSQRVAAEKQGQLQGANGAILSLTGLIGPLLYTSVFAFVIDAAGDAATGASFYIAAALVVAAALLAQAVTRARLSEAVR